MIIFFFLIGGIKNLKGPKREGINFLKLEGGNKFSGNMVCKRRPIQ
jgi:hypothetical protein